MVDTGAREQPRQLGKIRNLEEPMARRRECGCTRARATESVSVHVQRANAREHALADALDRMPPSI
eukprot:4173743-Pleurochrysis_carterae.AAC.2